MYLKVKDFGGLFAISDRRKDDGGFKREVVWFDKKREEQQVFEEST